MGGALINRDGRKINEDKGHPRIKLVWDKKCGHLMPENEEDKLRIKFSKRHQGGYAPHKDSGILQDFDA